MVSASGLVKRGLVAERRRLFESGNVDEERDVSLDPPSAGLVSASGEPEKCAASDVTTPQLSDAAQPSGLGQDPKNPRSTRLCREPVDSDDETTENQSGSRDFERSPDSFLSEVHAPGKGEVPCYPFGSFACGSGTLEVVDVTARKNTEHVISETRDEEFGRRSGIPKRSGEDDCFPDATPKSAAFLTDTSADNSVCSTSLTDAHASERCDGAPLFVFGDTGEDLSAGPFDSSTSGKASKPVCTSDGLQDEDVFPGKTVRSPPGKAIRATGTRVVLDGDNGLGKSFHSGFAFADLKPTGTSVYSFQDVSCITGNATSGDDVRTSSHPSTSSSNCPARFIGTRTFNPFSQCGDGHHNPPWVAKASSIKNGSPFVFGTGASPSSAVSRGTRSRKFKGTRKEFEWPEFVCSHSGNDPAAFSNPPGYWCGSAPIGPSQATPNVKSKYERVLEGKPNEFGSIPGSTQVSTAPSGAAATHTPGYTAQPSFREKSLRCRTQIQGVRRHTASASSVYSPSTADVSRKTVICSASSNTEIGSSGGREHSVDERVATVVSDESLNHATSATSELVSDCGTTRTASIAIVRDSATHTCVSGTAIESCPAATDPPECLLTPRVGAEVGDCATIRSTCPPSPPSPYQSTRSDSTAVEVASAEAAVPEPACVPATHPQVYFGTKRGKCFHVRRNCKGLANAGHIISVSSEGRDFCKACETGWVVDGSERRTLAPLPEPYLGGPVTTTYDTRYGDCFHAVASCRSLTKGARSPILSVPQDGRSPCITCYGGGAWSARSSVGVCVPTSPVSESSQGRSSPRNGGASTPPLFGTANGDCFHRYRDCYGLRNARTVISVEMSGRRACYYCK